MEMENDILLGGLVSAISNVHPQIRICAIENLAEMGQVAHPHLQLVIAAASDEVPDVRRAAYAALPRIGSAAEIVSTLESGLSDPHHPNHGYAVMALGDFKWGDAVTLSKLFDCVDKHTALHSDAPDSWHWLGCHMCETIKAGGYFQPTPEFLAAFSDPRERVRWVAVHSINTMDRRNRDEAKEALDSAFLPVLEERLKLEQSPELQFALIQSFYEKELPLTETGEETILTYLRHAESSVRALAARLAERQGLSIPRDLQHQVRDDEELYQENFETIHI